MVYYDCISFTIKIRMERKDGHVTVKVKIHLRFSVSQMKIIIPIICNN